MAATVLLLVAATAALLAASMVAAVGVMDDACITVEYDDANANNATVVFNAERDVHHEGHNVYSAATTQSVGGRQLYFVSHMSMHTLMGTSNVSGWALDPHVSNSVPAYFLGECAEEQGNMGPDTCTVTYHNLGTFYQRQFSASRLRCTACSDDYYLVSLTKEPYCAPKKPSGATCLDSEQCDSSLCWGYHCCAGSVVFNTTSCSACDSSGECVCDYRKLCERVGTALYCKDQDLISAPCSIPTDTTQLDLQNNSLTTIPQSLVSSLTNLQSLCLADNPLDCCQVSFLSDSKCLDLECKKVSTCTYRNMPMVRVPVADIHQSDISKLCGSDPVSGDDSANLTRILGAIVFCICIAAIAAFVYWRHKRKQSMLSSSSFSSSSSPASKDELAALLRINGDYDEKQNNNNEKSNNSKIISKGAASTKYGSSSLFASPFAPSSPPPSYSASTSSSPSSPSSSSSSAKKEYTAVAVVSSASHPSGRK